MKIRINNDVQFVCTVQISGVTVDLSTVTNLTTNIILDNTTSYIPTSTSIEDIFSNPYNYVYFSYNSSYTISGNTLNIYFPASVQQYTGRYKIVLQFDQATTQDGETVTTHYTIDSNDVITLVANTDDSNKYATVSVSVNGYVYPSSVSLNYTTATIAQGSTKQLSATVLPLTASDTTVTWSSSNSTICTVSSNGLITGISGGTATITATTVNDLTATCSVTVVSSSSDTTFPFTFPLILS